MEDGIKNVKVEVENIGSTKDAEDVESGWDVEDVGNEMSKKHACRSKQALRPSKKRKD